MMEQKEQLYWLRQNPVHRKTLWSRPQKNTAHIDLPASQQRWWSDLRGGPLEDERVHQVVVECKGTPLLLVHGSGLHFPEARSVCLLDLSSQEAGLLHLLDFLNRHYGLSLISFSMAPSQWTLYKFFSFMEQLLNSLSWFPATRRTVFVRLPDSWVQDEATDEMSLLLRGKRPYFVTLRIQFTHSYNVAQKKTIRTCWENFLDRSVTLVAED